MADYIPCATPPSKGFLSSINPLTIFDDVETLTPREFLRDFYTRQGLYDKLEDVDALVEAYSHQMHLLYAELDRKYNTKFCTDPPPVSTETRKAEPIGKHTYPTSPIPESPSKSAVSKIVLLGNSGVGKTNLISRLHKGEFNEEFTSTIGVEFLTNVFRVDKTNVKAQIWDTAGQERFHAMMSTYYRRAAGALLVFDIGNRSSLLDVKRWLDQLLNVAEPGLHATLVGNKCDLPATERAVTTEEARHFAATHHMAYMETSAKTGENVEQVFQDLVAAIHRARLAGYQEMPLSAIQLSGKKAASSSHFDCKLF